ncbi:ribosome biogenesis protein BRX1 homolog [Scaptodrosophila lebanonensis]|uniref:Ribosome biogenesis protein BRX1 homolog n=1 Tax=Drosophila lebanonensis TaxID=7225 RepID=A0A6J2TGK5_DROLE|nr:ribosome biogenesis protein BRX1 homolog [Scaptodrosophila lebanonensis]
MGRKFQKKKKVEQLEIVPKDENPPLPPQRLSDETIPRKGKWVNKQRVLVFSARGISHRDRHLMRDIKTLMPHHRSEAKMERSKTLAVVNEMCEMKHCNKALLFEGRRKRDLYMWISNTVGSTGPSVKFLVENIHTMAELKLTGNCLRGSRPLLSFDSKFDEVPHLKLLKELFVQTFAVPNHHPKSQPFIDHVYTFTYLDNRIWFRNFQILSEDGGLSEVGPRFVMNPVKIFDGSFTGTTIWENPDYVSPSKQRQMLKKAGNDKYVSRIEQKVRQEATRPVKPYEGIENDELFENQEPLETAKLIAAQAKKKNASEPKKSSKAALTKKIKDKQMKAVQNVIEQKKAKAKRVKKDK